MKLIKPSFEIIEQQPGLEGVYKQIELAGRTCYKSEDKITEDSAKSFVDRMINSNHGAMLEHGTVYLKLPAQGLLIQTAKHNHIDYENNKYSKTILVLENTMYPEQHLKINKNEEMFIPGVCWCYVTTNMRVLIENGWLDDLQYLCEPTEHHEKRITARFTCDRGVSHEFVRHRVFSFAQESTRYCNYSKDKFGNELTFIIPCWSKAIEGNYGTLREPLEIQFKEYDTFEMEFINELINIEFRYVNIINAGYTPQQARTILPNALKTELVMTGFISDWKHFFELRDAGSAHPQARELAQPLHQEFITRKYI